MSDLKKGEHQHLTVGKFTIYRHDYDGSRIIIVNNHKKSQHAVTEDLLEQVIDELHGK